MEIKKRAWDNFLDAVDFESDTSNFKYDFFKSKVTKTKWKVLR